MPPEKTSCAHCGVRDHALGGRTRTGEFMLALPIDTGKGRPAWPKIGTNGWCGVPDGEVRRLSIVRISLARATIKGAAAFLCQHCLATHHASQGMITDLFAVTVHAPAGDFGEKR